MLIHSSKHLPLRRKRHPVTLYESLERRVLLAGDSLIDELPVIISEFMADNDRSLTTRTKSIESETFRGSYVSPDWVELMNVSTESIDLGGMHLTDDATQLTKWQFPTGTLVDPGEQLIVFASGQNLTNPTLDEQGYLHASFRLNSEGEFLALTDHDGKVLHSYASEFPAQRPDISFGISMNTRSMIGPGATLEYFVPQDDALESQWRQPDFSDTDLMTRATGPIGFDRSAGYSEHAETIGVDVIERRSTANGRGTITILQYAPFTLSGRVTQWSFYSTKAHAITPVIVRQAAEEFEIVGIGRTRTSYASGQQTFTFDLQSGSDMVDGDGYFMGYKDGDNETDTPGVVMWESSANIARQYTGPQSGNLVEGQILSDGRDVRRTFSIQATTSSHVADINTNVDALMRDSSSLYARYPFDTSERDILLSLSLHIRYEDGFIATLNGVEIARRNAPAVASFDARATSNRLLVDANAFEEINISASIGTLTDTNNVLAIHTLNDSPHSDDFLLDVQLSGIEIQPLPSIGFASYSTPGEPNGQTVAAFASPPAFSVTRGLFDRPFKLELTTIDPPDATIYFTKDGSPPTIDNAAAVVYQQPLEITGTSVVRAASHRDGFLPSVIRSHTFIFPSDVADQQNIKSRARDDPVWGPQIPAALRSLPTVSIMTVGQISEEEIVASMELIFPDGREGLQIDAGLEAFGRGSLSFDKKSLRLSFKELYGPPKLDFDLFDDSTGVTQFDQILLRGGAHDSAVWTGGASYIRNRWAFDRQIEMGQPAPRGRFVHVYQNGEYRGLYHLMERPNASFMTAHFGGTEADYDVINAGDILNGDDQAWKELIESIGDDYDQVLEYLDEDNFADYMLLQFYGGNAADWRSNRNWMASRRREPGHGFKFFAWDNDFVLSSAPHASVVDSDGPQNIWSVRGGVRQYDEFRRILGDRAVKYFGEQGMFSAERLRRDIDQLAEEVRLAMIAEAARWGRPSFTPDKWQDAIDFIKDTYGPVDGPSRAEIVIEQMRNAHLIPEIDTPQFRVNGRTVHNEVLAAGDELTILANDGPVYYTLDGSDPRQVDPTLTYSTLVGETADVRVAIPADDSLGDRWLAIDFDDSSWLAGQTGVGFDTSGEFTPHINLDILDQMKSVNATAYLRMPFHVNDPSSYNALELDVQFNDGFVVYINGVEVKRFNAPDQISWDARAIKARNRGLSATTKTFNISQHVNQLRPGDNVLAVQALNTSPSGADFLITPMLRGGAVQEIGTSPTANRYTQTVVVPSGTTIKARALAGEWSSLREATAPRVSSPLRISEVMYHPRRPTSAEVAANFIDADDFEFIEIVNTSEESVELTNVRFVQTTVNGRTNGVEFEFDAGTISQLGPGQRVLIVENESAFSFRYGTGLPVAGQWSGGLSNNSEQITVMVDDQLLQQFTYDDDWYASTDGNGDSLAIIDADGSDLDSWNRSDTWRPSATSGGSPGSSRLLGDVDFDERIGVADIELLQAEIAADMTSERFDLTGDGKIDQSDLDRLVIDILQTRYGDANLDGCVNVADFEILAANYGRGTFGWSHGDFDGDHQIGFRDFITLANQFGFESTAFSAQTDQVLANDCLRMSL